MYCIHCGTKLNPEGKFCHNCGGLIVPPPLPEPGFSVSSPLPVETGTPSAYPEDPASINYPYPLPPSPTFPAPAGFNPPFPFTPSPFGPVFVPVPIVEQFHPLLSGAAGLPARLTSQPQAYYTYFELTGKVIVARKAGFWLRFVASLVDAFALLIPAIGLSVIFLAGQPSLTSSGSNPPPVLPVWFYFLLNALVYLYYFILTGATGQTLGKKLIGLRVIRFDGTRPDWFTSALRNIFGYSLSSFVFLLGFISAAWDPGKQGWHDKIARTLVIESGVLVEGRDFFLPGRHYPPSSRPL